MAPGDRICKDHTLLPSVLVHHWPEEVSNAGKTRLTPTRLSCGGWDKSEIISGVNAGNSREGIDRVASDAEGALRTTGVCFGGMYKRPRADGSVCARV